MLSEIITEITGRLTDQGVPARYQHTSSQTSTYAEVSLGTTSSITEENTRDNVFVSDILVELTSFDTQASRTDYIGLYESVMSALADWAPASAISFTFDQADASVALPENTRIVQRVVFTYRATWRFT